MNNELKPWVEHARNFDLPAQQEARAKAVFQLTQADPKAGALLQKANEAQSALFGYILVRAEDGRPVPKPEVAPPKPVNIMLSRRIEFTEGEVSALTLDALAEHFAKIERLDRTVVRVEVSKAFEKALPAKHCDMRVWGADLLVSPYLDPNAIRLHHKKLL